MRGTWHLVAPADLRWLLELLGPGVRKSAERRHRQLGLTPRLLARCQAVLERALDEAGPLTRDELRAALERAGVPTHEQRLSHLLVDAELGGLVCSGPMKGASPTWALLDGRVPRARARTREAALAELARRYFASRGPATLEDFRWWAGLTAADAREAHALARHELEADDADGRALFWVESGGAGASDALLPPFDEFLIAYQDRRDVLDARHVKRLNAGGGVIRPVVVHGGRVVGTWRRTLSRRRAGDVVAVEPTWFGPAPTTVTRRFREHAARYARFLGVTATPDAPRPRRA
jgi:hypothetical protein